MSINRVVVAGRLTRDPELKYSASGVAMCRFTVAVNRQFKKDGQDEADFINCLCFNKTAENLANYQKKGALIGVDGRIQTGKDTKDDGTTVFTTDVVADSIQFLESKKDAQPGQQQQAPQQQFNQQQQFQQQPPMQQNFGHMAPNFQPQQQMTPQQAQQFQQQMGAVVSEDQLPF